jgi:hypothetical protein
MNLPMPQCFEIWGGAISLRATLEQGTAPMRATRIVITLAASLASGIAYQSAAQSQEYRGTFEQQLACTGDVLSLCGDQIPDTNRIVACLRQNTPQLSDGCRAVFESNASVPQQQASPQQPSQTRRGDQQRRSADRY